MLTFFILTVLLARAGVFALTNISVDDTSSMVGYIGVWTSHTSSLDFGGGHVLCQTRGCLATFSFTGVAVYFLSPLWPYAVSVELNLDDGAGVTIDLTDPLATPTSGGPETAPWRPVWGATGLSNSSHSLVVSMPIDGNFAVVDGFIYTVDNDTSSSESTSSTTTTTTTPPAPTQETSTADASSSAVTTKAGDTSTSTTTTTSLVSTQITGVLGVSDASSSGVTTKPSNAGNVSTSATATTTTALSPSQTTGTAHDSSPGATTETAVNHKPHTTLIAGIVVGALILAAVAAMFLYYCRRRRRKLEAERALFTITSFWDPQTLPMTPGSSPLASGITNPSTPLPLWVGIRSKGGQMTIPESESESEVASSPPAYTKE